MLKRWCVSSNPKSRGKQIFLAQDIDFIWFLSDCVMNVLSGVVPINKTEMEKFESQLRQLSEKHFNALQRSKFFQATNKYKPRFEDGDLVRIAKPDNTLRKGYTQNYTDEVFTVLRLATTSPPTYNLIDANNVKILGKFYEPELVQVDVLNTEEGQ